MTLREGRAAGKVAAPSKLREASFKSHLLKKKIPEILNADNEDW